MPTPSDGAAFDLWVGMRSFFLSTQNQLIPYTMAKKYLSPAPLKCSTRSSFNNGYATRTSKRAKRWASVRRRWRRCARDKVTLRPLRTSRQRLPPAPPGRGIERFLHRWRSRFDVHDFGVWWPHCEPPTPKSLPFATNETESAIAQNGTGSGNNSGRAFGFISEGTVTISQMVIWFSQVTGSNFRLGLYNSLANRIAQTNRFSPVVESTSFR